MFLKDHLKVVFKKASLENNILVKENIINKWVHRFGIDALDDLLIQMLNSEEENSEEENQELLLNSEEENSEEENQELLLNSEEENSEEENQELLLNSEEENSEEESQELVLISEEKNSEEENQELVLTSEEENSEENLKEMRNKLKDRKDQVFDSNFNINKIESNDIDEDTYKIKLPLPEINNLRKWINKDKKAS
ncbi:glycoprotein [Prochlorococcus sp. AH-736-K09]|nr:glycoprotein [Prochlorococcus sp. AH-736-K09]